MEMSTPAGTPRFDGIGHDDTGALRGWRRGARDLAGDVAARVSSFRRRNTGRSPVMPGSRGGLRRSCHFMSTMRRGFSAPTERRRTLSSAAAPALSGFPRFTQTRFAETIRRTAEAAASISDLQFTDAYRVPFQYSRYVRKHLPAAAFMQSSAGVTVTDLDGNRFYDITGSYGVNLLGYDFYKQCHRSRRCARARSWPGARPLSPL